jgi:hypothetical protein
VKSGAGAIGYAVHLGPHHHDISRWNTTGWPSDDEWAALPNNDRLTPEPDRAFDGEITLDLPNRGIAYLEIVKPKG